MTTDDENQASLYINPDQEPPTIALQLIREALTEQQMRDTLSTIRAENKGQDEVES